MLHERPLDLYFQCFIWKARGINMGSIDVLKDSVSVWVVGRSVTALTIRLHRRGIARLYVTIPQSRIDRLQGQADVSNDLAAPTRVFSVAGAAVTSDIRLL